MKRKSEDWENICNFYLIRDVHFVQRSTPVRQQGPLTQCRMNHLARHLQRGHINDQEAREQM